MRAGQRSTTFIVAAITLLLALAAGVAIPMASGRNPAGEPVAWTPPPATATMTSAPSPRPVLVTRVTATTETTSTTEVVAPTDAPTRTAVPTGTPKSIPATETASPTGVPNRAVNTRQPSSTASASGFESEAVATPSAGPSEEETPAGTSGPSGTGSLSGEVDLSDNNGPYVEIAAEQLNLRMAPTSDAVVLALGLQGDRFNLLGRSEDGIWLQVCCINDEPVWLASGYVTVTGAIETLPVVP